MKPDCCTYCRVNLRHNCGLQEKCSRVKAYYRQRQEVLLAQYTINSTRRLAKLAGR